MLNWLDYKINNYLNSLFVNNVKDSIFLKNYLF